MSGARWTLGLLVVLAASCGDVAEGERGGPCPCRYGDVCEEGVCVEGPFAGCFDDPRLNFEVVWTTPNGALLALTSVVRFPAEGEVLTGEGSRDSYHLPADPTTVHRVTPADRPELATIQAFPARTLFVLDGLAPGTTSWAQLVTRAADGEHRDCLATIDASIRTPALPSHTTILFDASAPSGFSFEPPGFRVSEGSARFDVACVSLDPSASCPTCCSAAPTIILVDGLDLSPLEGPATYLELSVGVEVPAGVKPPVNAHRLGLVVDGEGGRRGFSMNDGVTLPYGTMPRRIQIPLDQVASGIAQSTRLASISISGDWIDGSVMRLDDVAIVY